MITRREFIKYTTMAGAGVAFPGVMKFAALAQAGQKLGASPALAKFVDALPIPAVRKPTSMLNGVPLYTITMKPGAQKLHRDAPPTNIWGYDGITPASTFDVNTGEPMYVRWVNNLPTPHLLQASIDHTLPGMMGRPDVRGTIHVHGGEVPFDSDGVFATNGQMSQILPGQSATFYYPNIQKGATIWYHDHAIGLDRINVMAGMAGFFIIRDPVEKALNLPSGAFEVPIVIQDREVDAGAQIVYPTVGDNPTVHPQWVPEFFGDLIVVNGKVYPYLQVEPRKYRFRFLDGSNARFYNLGMTPQVPWWQIGTDGGLLMEPVSLRKLLFAPGERCDVIVDFSGAAGKTITLHNDAPAPYPGGGGGVDLPDVMQFRVTKPLSGPDTSVLPGFLRPVYDIPENAAVTQRDIVMTEIEGPLGPLNMFLNGKGMMDPPSEFPQLGNIEIWRFINTTVDTHPMHVHLVQFRLLDRQPFDVALFNGTGKIVFTGPPTPPDPNERGWKDTARVSPGSIARYAMKWVSFTGGYVYHCHILEHEENDMMRPYTVTPTVYYFAEGSCRPDFDAYITIENPEKVMTSIKITYMLGNGQTKVQTVQVAPHSRMTLKAKDFLGQGDDAAHDFSAKVESTNGVQFVAERSMYFNYNEVWTGGHCVVGGLMPEPLWYFAEGNTRPNYDSYLTIMNPNKGRSKVKITYMLGNSTQKVQNVTVPATSRATVTVKDFLGVGDDTAHDFSAKVETTDGTAIVVERPMYFNYKGKWTGGHDVVGAVGPAPTWYFAEGTCRPGFDSFICVQNPGLGEADVKVTFMRGDGTSTQQLFAIPPMSRYTLNVRDVLGTGDDAAHDFSAVVACVNGQEIVAERTMYFNYNGQWTGGSCVLGSVLPDKAWNFAEGTCRPNFDSFITILNPDPGNAASVVVTYMLGNGSTKTQNVNVPKASRFTINVKDFLGSADDSAHDFSAKVVTNNSVEIVAERSMYFNYQSVWNGGHATLGFSY